MADFKELRSRFPLLGQKTYLNSGSYAALAGSVRAAFVAYLDDRLAVGTPLGRDDAGHRHDGQYGRLSSRSRMLWCQDRKPQPAQRWDQLFLAPRDRPAVRDGARAPGGDARCRRNHRDSHRRRQCARDRPAGARFICSERSARSPMAAFWGALRRMTSRCTNRSASPRKTSPPRTSSTSVRGNKVSARASISDRAGSLLGLKHLAAWSILAANA